nr:hypothetical protein A8713_032580 [Streptomyces sp. SAT1]
MDEDDGAAPVEVLPERFEARVAEVDAVVVALHGHAVGAQHVERVRDLRERAVHVGQGQGGEETGPVRVGGADPGAGLVDLAGQRAGRALARARARAPPVRR